MPKPKIVVIVGPTASGKTSLSITLAKKFNGEIISADSRQVYRGLNLGTGKVTHEEMEGIPHHLLDVADPQETYTVASYVHDGRQAITDIHSINKLPIIVGGTFFYIDALLGKISTPEVGPNGTLRTKLEALSDEALFQMLTEKDPERSKSIDPQNKRRLIRALEIVDALGVVPETHPETLYDTLTLGITITRERLQENIHTRLITRLDSGMIDEVKNLHEAGLSYERLNELGIEYKYIVEFLQEKISYEEMCTQIETKSRQYAKRQMTWLKQSKDIVWIEPSVTPGVENIVQDFLNDTIKFLPHIA